MPEKNSQSDFYVYIYFRPNGIPCYVGKGKGKRWILNEKKSHNKYLARIIAKAGGEIPKVKIRENLTEAQAFEIEIAFIKAIGRGKNGPLVNLTDGGDGVVGHKRTPEQRAQMSLERRGKCNLTEESKKKISKALKNVPKTKEHGAAVSAAKKGKSQGPLSEEHRKAIGDGNRGQKRSPEAKAAIRAGQENMTPEARALKGIRISISLTGKKLSDSHRASISRVQIGRIRSQEIKNKISATMKALRAAQRAAKERAAALETELI